MPNVQFSKRALAALTQHEERIGEIRKSIEAGVERGVRFHKAWAAEWSKPVNQPLYRELRAAGVFDAPVAKADADYSDGQSGGVSYSESDRVGAQDGSTVFADSNDSGGLGPEDMADYYAPEETTTNEAADTIEKAANKLREDSGYAITKEKAFATICKNRPDLYAKAYGRGRG